MNKTTISAIFADVATRQAAKAEAEQSRATLCEKVRAYSFGDAFRKDKINAYKAAQDLAELRKIEAAAAKQCAAYALKSALVRAYGEIVPRFVGKPAGEKTREKFAEEVRAALVSAGVPEAVCVYFSRKYDGTLDGLAAYVGGTIKTEAGAQWIEGRKTRAIVDEKNRFDGSPLCTVDKIDDEGRILTDKPRTVEEFAAHFLATEKELDSLAAEYEKKRKALFASANFGDMAPATARTGYDSRTI